MNKTLFISDLDGTLLNKDAELSEYAKKALNSMISDGLCFSIATARTLASAGVILADLDLQIPVILMNGVLIYDTKKQSYIQVNTLPVETVAAVIDILEKSDATGFMYELNDGKLKTFYESLEQKPLRDFAEERMTLYNKPFYHTDSFSDVSPEHIIYFALLDTQERLQPVHAALQTMDGFSIAFYKDNYSPDLWYLELFSTEASKRSAVCYLRGAYGYERVIGFGDNTNDIPMFEACDVRVAVENATPEVKAAADHICAANGADGVVKWLEEKLCKSV